eukprot:4887826-Pyramimonas_sp.AAC.1
MVGRQEGSTCDRFDPDVLVAALAPVARLKKPPCDFDFLHYGKRKRSQAADRDALEEYYPILKPVLGVAPKGLPIKQAVRLTWSRLQDEHGIMTEHSKNEYRGRVDLWLDAVSNRVCTVCRHVRDLSKSTTQYVKPKVKELMDMIDHIPSGSGGPRPQSAPVRAPQVQQQQDDQMQRPLVERPSDTSSSSVQVCSVTCRCPACYVPTVVNADSPDDEDSDTAAAAK